MAASEWEDALINKYKTRSVRNRASLIVEQIG